jgi:hypothetical protein
VRSLLWSPSFHSRLNRRIGFPTWSWSGWQGAVDIPYWLHDHPTEQVHNEQNLFALEINEAFDSELHLAQETGIATVLAWPIEDEQRLGVKITSSIVMLEVRRVFKDDEYFDEDFEDFGDLWCVLDRYGKRIPHYTCAYRFGQLGCCFRVERPLSEELVQAGPVVEFLLLVHWTEKKENGEDISVDGKTEVGDSIFAMLILRNDDGTARRVAIVSIPFEIWTAASLKSMIEVDLV